MQRIEQPCPQCEKRLKIDAGFIGSICRCKYCGVLISVSKKGGKVRLKPADQTVFAQAVSREKRADAPQARKSAATGRTAPGDAMDDTLPPGSPVIEVDGQPRPAGPVPTVSGSGSPWHRPDSPPGTKPRISAPSHHTPGFVERNQMALIGAGVVVLLALVGAAVWAILRSQS